MSDLPQDNLRSNPYYRNRRIRRFLIRYGLINRQGDIVPSRPRARDAIEQNGNREQTRPQRPTLRSPGRAKSARHSSREPRNRSRQPSAKPKSPEKTRCRVIMTYIGRQTNIEYDKSWFQEQGDEIVVMQQHCGGENLTVYKGFVKPQETFAFDSQRHADYPFALALYINGLIDCRVSVCCEYKHRKNVPLGGPSGSFSISGVQKVTPCRSCRFERLKKKSKSTITLDMESSRYRRSVVPRIPSRRSTPSPNKESPAPGERPASTQPADDDDKKPVVRVKSPSISQTSTPPPKDKDKGSTAPPPPPKPHISTLPPVSRKSSSSSPSPLEADDKKPPASSTKPDQSVPQKTYNTRAPSPPLSSSSDDGNNKQIKPLVKPTKTTVSIHRSTDDEDSDSSRKPSKTLEDDDKKPQMTSAKPLPPVTLIDQSARQKTPDVSQTPEFAEDDKKPPANPSTPMSKGHLSTVQKLVTSQKNGDDYETDFDESNDDDDDDGRRPLNSRYGRPRISDAHLSDNGDRNQPGRSLRSPRQPDSTNDEINRKSSTLLNGKEKPHAHFQKNSSSPDKMTNELNTKSNHDRLSSSSSEDFFGIKRSSTKEKNKPTPGLTSDWFETTSRNDPDENNPTPKPKSWEKMLFSDNEN